MTLIEFSHILGFTSLALFIGTWAWRDVERGTILQMIFYAAGTIFFILATVWIFGGIMIEGYHGK